jgi:hypothetical protein
MRMNAISLHQRSQKAFGAWCSLVARLFWVQEAAGSNPAAPTVANAEGTTWDPVPRKR